MVLLFLTSEATPICYLPEEEKRPDCAEGAPPELPQRDGSFHYLAWLQQQQLSVLKEQQFPGLGAWIRL